MPCTLSTTPLYLGVATGIYLLSNLFLRQYSSKILILEVLIQRYVYSLPLLPYLKVLPMVAGTSFGRGADFVKVAKSENTLALYVFNIYKV